MRNFNRIPDDHLFNPIRVQDLNVGDSGFISIMDIINIREENGDILTYVNSSGVVKKKPTIVNGMDSKTIPMIILIIRTSEGLMIDITADDVNDKIANWYVGSRMEFEERGIDIVLEPIVNVIKDSKDLNIKLNRNLLSGYTLSTNDITLPPSTLVDDLFKDVFPNKNVYVAYEKSHNEKTLLPSNSSSSDYMKLDAFILKEDLDKYNIPNINIDLSNPDESIKQLINIIGQSTDLYVEKSLNKVIKSINKLSNKKLK